jgi:hypothetical protein
MNKPIKTPFRKAADHLKDKGVIKRDHELLEPLGITSKGTLSNYLKFGLPSHLQKKFQNRYGPEVDAFFVDEDQNVAQHHVMIAEPGEFYISPREHIETIKQHNKDLKDIILAQLKTMSSQLTEISSNSNEILAGV